MADTVEVRERVLARVHFVRLKGPSIPKTQYQHACTCKRDPQIRKQKLAKSKGDRKFNKTAGDVTCCSGSILES
jgi:hypothetical protein